MWVVEGFMNRHLKMHERKRRKPGKIGIIVVKLVPEASDISNEDIEKEILKELEEYARIPYMAKVEKVKVLEEV